MSTWSTRSRSQVARGAGFRRTAPPHRGVRRRTRSIAGSVSGPSRSARRERFAVNYEVHNRLPAATGTVSCLAAVCEIRVSDFGDPDYDASALPRVRSGRSAAHDSCDHGHAGHPADRPPDRGDRRNRLRPGRILFVQLCPRSTDQCSPADLGSFQADAAGQLLGEHSGAPARRSRTPAGVEAVDCAVDACQVIVSQGGGFTLTASHRSPSTRGAVAAAPDGHRDPDHRPRLPARR